MQPERAWWDVASIIATAFATVAVAFFGGVQLWREFNRSNDAQRTATTAVSALGYLIRRRLISWLGPAEKDEEHFEEWARAARNARTFDQELLDGERDFRELMTLLAYAPRGTAKAARKAYLLYLEGTRRITAYADTPRPQGPEFFEWLQLRHDAVADLCDCVHALENGVIEVELLNEETILTRKRRTEDPWQQLGEAVAAHLEENERQDLERERALTAPDIGTEIGQHSLDTSRGFIDRLQAIWKKLLA